MVDRLVDQLVRHAVKAHMASQRNRTSTLTLKIREILTQKCIDKQQMYNVQTWNFYRCNKS